MNLNESIINIRVELQNSNLKMSGKNTHAGFTYFELADFLPKLNELMLKYSVNDQLTIGKEYAELTLLKGDEKQTYTIPFFMFDVPLTKTGLPMMQQIQYLGALNTYCKRYLYLNAFGITDGEVIDALNQSEIIAPKQEIKEYISKEQATGLNKYAIEQGQEIKKVLEFFKVDGLLKLTTKQYQFAMSKLKNKEFV